MFIKIGAGTLLQQPIPLSLQLRLLLFTAGDNLLQPGNPLSQLTNLLLKFAQLIPAFFLPGPVNQVLLHQKSLLFFAEGLILPGNALQRLHPLLHQAQLLFQLLILADCLLHVRDIHFIGHIADKLRDKSFDIHDGRKRHRFLKEAEEPFIQMSEHAGHDVAVISVGFKKIILLGVMVIEVRL